MLYFDEEVSEGHILIFLNYLGTSMGPVIKTPCFPCRDVGSTPGQGAQLPYAVQGEAKISNKLSVMKLSNIHKKESY